MITIAEFGLLRDDNAYTFSRMIIRAQKIQNSASYLWKKRFGSMPGGHLRPPLNLRKPHFFVLHASKSVSGRCRMLHHSFQIFMQNQFST